MLGALDLLPKNEIARLAQIGNGAIVLARQAEIAGAFIHRPIASKVLTVCTVARAFLRDHRHLMRVERQRRLAALAKIILEIDALPAIRAPELAHGEIRPRRS